MEKPALTNKLEKKIDVADLLSEQDREILMLGLEKLANHLSEKDPKDLPSNLVFIDASARPLTSLIKPIVKKIYQAKDVPLPLFQYYHLHARPSQENYPQIATSSDPQRSRQREIDFLQWQIDNWKSIIDEDDEISDEMKRYYQERITENESILERFDDIVDRSEQFFSESYKRLQEIQESAPGPILFIDDYVSDRHTLEYVGYQLKQLSDEIPSVSDWEFFAFFQTFRHRDMTRPPNWPNNIIIGVNDYDNPEIKDYRGLRYRSNQETYEQTRKIKEGVTGVQVEKSPGKYSKVSPLRDNELRALLNNELTSIGNQVANHL